MLPISSRAVKPQSERSRYQGTLSVRIPLPPPCMPSLQSKKFSALVGQLSEPAMSDKERLAMVEVLAPFTYLYTHQVGESMCGLRRQVCVDIGVDVGVERTPCYQQLYATGGHGRLILTAIDPVGWRSGLSWEGLLWWSFLGGCARATELKDVHASMCSSHGG